MAGGVGAGLLLLARVCDALPTGFASLLHASGAGEEGKAIQGKQNLRMAFQNQSYQNLRAFIAGLHYIDFSTVFYESAIDLLKEAGVLYEYDTYIIDVYPYTTAGIDIKFELVQLTGHRNRIRLSFTADEMLSEFHMYTSL